VAVSPVTTGVDWTVVGTGVGEAARGGTDFELKYMLAKAARSSATPMVRFFLSMGK
jgi:hypothetical protein